MQVKALLKQIIFILVLVNLTSCSLMSPIKTDPSNTFVLKCIAHPSIKKPRHKISLLVLPMNSHPLYNTKEMAYMLYPFQVDYFSKNRWAETPAKMLTPLIIRTLQKTHYFYAVLNSPPIANYNYVLNTHLLELQQHFYRCQSVVRLVVDAELVNAATNQLVASKHIVVNITAPENSPRGGAIAANIATQRMLSILAKFCLRHL